MIKIKTIKWFFLAVFLLLIPIIGANTLSEPKTLSGPEKWDVFFSDDFESGNADAWELESGWGVLKDGDNFVLNGNGHKWARHNERWGDYNFSTKIKLIEGAIHVNYRVYNCERYFIGFNPGGLYLWKTKPCTTHTELITISKVFNKNEWYNLEVAGNGNNIKVYVNGILEINYTDENDPILFGSIAFETLDSNVSIDDVMIMGHPPPTLTGFKWKKLGGPLGGIGYDVRIDTKNPNVMYVSDINAGVSKSYNGGELWESKNNGITTRAGQSNDGIPVFCITVDPNDNNTLWIGMQGSKGVYKSIDAGETWIKMVNGIESAELLAFRQFTVEPGNSNVVYLSGEQPIFGGAFSQSKGFIYKTIDGGKNWSLILESNAIMRHIIIDPTDHNTIYAAAGIFDRNDVEPEGIFKSTDGGNTWRHINTGLENASMTVGGLAMDPKNHNILYATTGRHAGFIQGDLQKETWGRIYKSADGGEHWTKVYGDYMGYDGHLSINYITIDPINSNNIYAATEVNLFISRDAGKTWHISNWNPPGVVGGIPISIAVDSENPDIVYINSYIGGVFRSNDAGETWEVSSKGYSGAQTLGISTYPDDPNVVYANGRQSIAKSINGGDDWNYLNYPPLSYTEGLAVEIDPNDQNLVLVSNRFYGFIHRTLDSGKNWELVFSLNETHYPENLHGISSFVFSPSNTDIIYAGYQTAGEKLSINSTQPSYGMIKSLDAGKNWQFINNGLEGTTKNINDIAVHPSNPNIVYIATLFSGVFRSTDGGKNWVEMNIGLSNLDIRSIAIDPNNPDQIYIGVENGGVMKSIDGGNSWLPAINGMIFEASIRSIVINSSNPHIIYAADYHGGVYLSQDSAEQWIKINEGLENRAVTDLTISKDGSVLYAATDGGGVFRLGTPAALPPDILSYYRSLGNNPDIIETTDLLKAADDWGRDIAPTGFADTITTQQLLELADEWARG